MKCEAAVAIPASKGLALTSVCHQYARNSFVPQYTIRLLLALERVTKDQMAVLEKSSLPPLSQELSERELRVGQDKSPILGKA